MKNYYQGTLADHGYTSVWTRRRMGPVSVRCTSCGTMNPDPDASRTCSCGAALPAPRPFW